MYDNQFDFPAIALRVLGSQTCGVVGVWLTHGAIRAAWTDTSRGPGSPYWAPLDDIPMEEWGELRVNPLWTEVASAIASAGGAELTRDWFVSQARDWLERCGPSAAAVRRKKFILEANGDEDAVRALDNWASKVQRRLEGALSVMLGEEIALSNSDGIPRW